MIRKQYKCVGFPNFIGEIRDGQLWWYRKDEKVWKKESSSSYVNDVNHFVNKPYWVEVPPEEFIGERQFAYRGKLRWEATESTSGREYVLQILDGVGSIFYDDGTNGSDKSWKNVILNNAANGTYDELLPSQFLVPKTQKEDKMTNFAVKTGNKILNEVIQKAGAEAGYSWPSGRDEVRYPKAEGIGFNTLDKIMFRVDILPYKDGKTVSVEECAELLTVKPIMIGEHEVKADKGGLHVGCKSLSREKVLELKGLINKKSPTCDDGTQIQVDHFRERLVVDGNEISFDLAKQIIALVE